MSRAQAIANLLKNPFVLRCAWEKTQAWYDTVEWAPEPELSAWKADPWPHLVRIANQLAEGNYRPRPMRQVPYPKQNGEIRHYVLPELEDQVAHMIYAVLLAPFIEARLANVNFGSRWYRALRRWYPDDGSPCWIRKSFSLADRRLYDPFNRDYGIFRRLASWIAEDFTGGHFRPTGPTDRMVEREEYPTAMLPFVHRPTFPPVPRQQHLAFARLDLRKAFPSFHRRTVRQHLLQMLSDDLPAWAPRRPERWDVATDLGTAGVALPEAGSDGQAGILEMPWHRLAGAAGEPLRLALARRWMDLLDQARFVQADGAVDLRDVVSRPFSPRQRRFDDAFGLPTGLAVSPLLMNVALFPLDYAMIRHLEPENSDVPFTGAYLRFADDIIVFERDPEALQSLLNALRQTLESFERYGDGLHPQLNWSKARPEAVRNWGLAGRWDAPLELPQDQQIRRDHPGEFVTYLVQHLSDVAGEHIVERSGGPARTRLARLHDLARWDIADVEVRKDTRLAFVVNKLARAWIPWPAGRIDPEAPGARDRRRRELEEYRLDVEDMRRSIRRAILEVPFKFKLWRSAIVAALRADLAGQAPEALPHPQGVATGIEWLRGLLELIAVGGAWEQSWPSVDCQSSDVDQVAFAAWQARETALGFRAARVSFIRAHFWREVAKLIRQVEAAITAGRDINPSPAAWYARAWGPHSARGLLQALVETDAWASALYPNADIALPTWEREAICLALAASADASHASRIPPGNVRLVTVLGGNAVQQQVEVLVAPYRQSQVHEALSIEARVRALTLRPDRFQDQDIDATITEGIAYLADHWRTTFASRAARPHEFLRLLEFYKALRHVLFSTEASSELRAAAIAAIGGTLVRHGGVLGAAPNLRQEAALFQAMWGTPCENSLAHWDICPTRVPTVGLPTPWALKIYADLLGAALPRRQHIAPEAVIGGPWAPTLAEHRRQQLDAAFMRIPAPLPFPNGNPSVGRWSEAWSTLPHPTAFIPEWLGWNRARSQRWHATLAFFLALDGDERFHDAMWRSFPNPPSWTEHLARRCATPLPSCIWRLVDGAMHSTVGFEHVDLVWLTETARGQTLMRHGSAEHVTSIEIRQAFPVTDQSGYLQPETPPPSAPDIPMGWEDLVVPKREDERLRTLKVRIGQIAAEPPWTRVPDAWPVPRSICEGPLEQAKLAIAHVGTATPGDPPHLVVFPELALHAEDAIEIARQAAHDLGAGVLSGLFWHEVPPPVKPARPVPGDAIRYFVNEAVLAVPNLKEPRRTSPYMFRIRKPRPAHIEYGVEQALTARPCPVHAWRLLPGNEWLRFDHPNWGPFAIGICSDLLDIKPWAAYKGEILHLFLVAWNHDTRLYDALTWVRAYELYSNVVLVNHGQEGGSLAWTPRHRDDRHLFSAYGREHFVITDVVLPVEELHQAQQAPREQDLQRHMDKANKMFNGEHPPRAPFYARPPHYPLPP